MDTPLRSKAIALAVLLVAAVAGAIILVSQTRTPAQKPELPPGYSAEKLALQFALHFRLPISVDLNVEAEPVFRRWMRSPTVGFFSLGNVDADTLADIHERTATAAQTLAEQTLHVLDVGQLDQTDGDILLGVIGENVTYAEGVEMALDIHEATGGLAAPVRDRARQLLIPNACSVFLLSPPGGRRDGSYRAVILVDHDFDRMDTCLIEELAHVVGMIGDVPLDAPVQLEMGTEFDTLFEHYAEPEDRRNTLSAADLVILRTLRRSEFVDRMPLQEAIDLAYEYFSTFEQ